jgi:hypothetical protein
MPPHILPEAARDNLPNQALDAIPWLDAGTEVDGTYYHYVTSACGAGAVSYRNSNIS